MCDTCEIEKRPFCVSWRPEADRKRWKALSPEASTAQQQATSGEGGGDQIRWYTKEQIDSSHAFGGEATMHKENTKQVTNV